MDNSLTNAWESMTPEINILTAVRRHWIVAALTAATVFGGMAFKTLREPGVYRSEALIVTTNRVSVPIVQDTQEEEFIQNLPTEIEILQSFTLLNRAMQTLAPSYRSIPMWEIESNLSLSQPEDTNVLAVSYEDTNATRAKAILDAIVDTYINYSRETQRSPVENATKFVEKRIAALEETLEQSSQALTRFRTQHNLEDPQSSIQLAYTTKERLQQSIDTAEVEVKLVEHQYQALQTQMIQIGQNPETSLNEAVLSQDDSYRSVLQQLNALEVEYKLAQTRYTPDHPIVQDLKERQEELEKLVASESQNYQQRGQKIELGEIQQNLASQLLETRLNLSTQQERLSELRKQATIANRELQRLLQLQQKYRELARQYDLNAQTLNDLLAKLQQLRIQEAQDTFSWKVIEEPNLPTIPIARSRVRGLVLGLIAGVLAGVGIAYFLEKIDGTFKETKDIKKATKLPILGVIPQAQRATRVGGENSDSFTEAIRSLALSLSFQQSHSTGKVLAITSAIAGDGKTTITYNLGLALSELNKRVLMVDANLGNPSLHNVFNLPNEQGLTTAIATEQSWQSFIQSLKNETAEEALDYPETELALSTVDTLESIGSIPTSVFARVSTAAILTETEVTPERPVEQYPDVLTTGPVSMASFPWLVSPEMEALLREWRQAYDYILVDTSDLMGLADAQSLTPKVDDVILVVSLNRVEQQQVTEALELLKRNNSKVAGIVVNTVGRGKGKTQNQSEDIFT